MNRRRRTIPVKMDAGFYDELRKIAAMRVIAGKDRKYNVQMVQRKIPRHRLWSDIKRDLQIADFIKDEEAQYKPSAFNIYTFAIVSFLVVLLFGGLIYAMGLLNNVFLQVGIDNPQGVAGVNLTQAAQQTFGQVNNSIQALRLVAISIIFGEILLFVVGMAFTRTHPILMIPYIFIIFLGVWLAAPISNAYETILASNTYDGLLESFTGTNWLLLNLPMVVLITGILGGMFMFINILRPTNEEGI